MPTDRPADPRSPLAPHAPLTTGPVARTLLRLAAPMFMAMFVMMGFNLVDTFFVGQLGTEPLAAMGFTLAVVMAVNSVAMGLGMGTTAVVARVIGQGDVRTARRLTTDAMFLGVCVALVVVAVGVPTIRPLFTLLGATGDVLEHVRSYMVIWYFGLPLIIVPQVGNSGLRATGDTATPAKIMVSALLVNLVLDPLFIFGWGPVPGYGLQGAAMATVFAQAFALAISIRVLRRRGLATLERDPAHPLLGSWRRILTISVPATLTQLISPISTGVITAVVASYGVAAVAGFGVAGRLEMLAAMLVMALGAGLVPFVGQNWGAGRKDRVGRAIGAAIGLSAGWGAAIWFVALAFGGQIASVFNDDPAVVGVVVSYLRIVFPSLMFLGALVTVTNALNALHRPLASMTLSAVRMFGLYVPFALAGSALIGLTGVWWAAFAANVIAGLIALAWFRRLFSRIELCEGASHAPGREDAEPVPTTP